MEWSRIGRRSVVPALALAALAASVWQWDKVAGLRTALADTEKPRKLAPPTRAAGVIAEGRLVAYPGAEVTVGTDLGGRIRRLDAKEKSAVKNGDVLAELDASEQQAAMNEALSRVREADVDIKFLDGEVDRTRALVGSGSLPKQLLDKAERDRDAASARKQSAIATAARLGAVVAKSKIVAPIDGVVLVRHAEAGETVAPGAPLVTIADLSRTRVEAEIDEYDVGRVKLGAPATIRAEGLDGQTWQGKVEEIPDSVTPRRLKPQDPARPTDTRVLRVKIALSGPTPLKLGQRVEIELR
jgi:RND family efflux transporter MFP subunit